MSCTQPTDIDRLHTAYAAIILYLYAGELLQGITHVDDAEPFHVSVRERLYG